jgi:predicted ATPase
MDEPIVAWTRADILRIAGGDQDVLEAAWRKAIDSARAKGMRIFELRATVGLARLMMERGQTSMAREILAPIHDSFTEGSDTFDLVEAKRLLAELAS